MNIIFIGCVESSYKLLSALLENGILISGVISKQNSSFNSDFCDLSPLCNEYGIDILYVKNINDNETIEFISNHNADIGFCFGWSQLVKDHIIKLFPMGIVGFHPALLPYNRGRHPLIWALVLGLEKTASTFFMLDSNADTGNIISQKSIEITYNDDAESLYKKVLDIAVIQELDFVKKFENGTIEYRSQESSIGNVWRKRTKKDGLIDWRMNSRSIYNLVRGLTHPYVGSSFEFQGKEYKVWKVKEVKCEKSLKNIEPGKVLSINMDGTIDIKVYDNIIRLIDFTPISVKKGDYL